MPLRALLLLLLTAPAALSQTLTAPAVLVGDDLPSAPAGVQDRPAIARGDSGYLVVCEDTRNSFTGAPIPPNGLDPNADVYASLLDENGSLISPHPIVVSSRPWHQERPQVAWNGTHYLVVWVSTRQAQFFYTDGIYAARVTQEGEVLDDPPIVIEDSDDFDETLPVVASDGNEWVVGWGDYDGTLASLDAARVGPTGLVLDKRTLIASNSGAQLPVNYRLAHAQDRYLFVYQRGSTNGVRGRFFDSTLGPLGAELTFTASGGLRPDVASNGTDFFVLWLGGGLRGTPVSVAGTIAVPGGAEVSGGAGTTANYRPSVAWDGTQWAVAFENSSGVLATHVPPAGLPAPTSTFDLSGATSRIEDPNLASGSSGVVCAWNDWRHRQDSWGIDHGDVFKSRLASDGAVTGIGEATLSPPAQSRPALAGDAAAGHLVTYISSTSGNQRILAQRVDPRGVAIDPAPIVLHTSTRKVQSVDVAFDGLVWLVVWDEIDDTPTYVTLRTWFRRVLFDGTPMDAGPTEVMEGARPAVAALNGVFLVAARHHHNVTASNSRIRVRRIEALTGVPLDPGFVDVGLGSGFPDVAAFDDRWLVVYNGATGAIVLPDGTPQAPFFAASTASSGDAKPQLASIGSEMLLVWSHNGSLLWNADVHARRILPDTTSPDPITGFPVCTVAQGQTLVTAAWDGEHFALAWNDYRIHPPVVPGIGDVYAGRVTTAAAPLDPTGIPVANGLHRAEGSPAVAGADGVALIAYSAETDAPYVTPRITLRALDEHAVGTPVCNPAVPSSSGTPASIAASGETASAANDLTLYATGMPANRFGYFLTSRNDSTGTTVPGSQGRLCLAGSIGRFNSQVLNTGANGAFALGVDLSALPVSPPVPVVPGDSWTFQAWFRDTNPGPTSNFTDAVRVGFQ